MTYCYHWLTFSRELIDQDMLFTNLKVQDYLWKKWLNEEHEDEEPVQDPVLDLNELG